MSNGSQPVPESHPVRSLFLSLAERGLEQSKIRDEASIRYVSNLLMEFVRTEALYRYRDAHGRRLEHLTDLIAAAEQTTDPGARKHYYQHLGDYTLFMLGLFPERLDRPRRTLSPGYYAEQGRRSYNIAADLAWTDAETPLFRRLASRFEEYVSGLNWVNVYIHDPFFQYMFREFGIT